MLNNWSTSMVARIMSLWAAASLTCMQNVGAWRVFNKIPIQNVVSWTAIILGCEMWTRAEGIGTILTNATGRGGAKPCHFHGGPQCLCQCSGL
jgi:hypothetical protein